MDKIRVAHLVGNATLGGVANCVLSYFNNVDREKFSFDLITYGESPLDEKVRRLGGKVFYIHDFRDPIRASIDLKKVLRNNGYDVFHCHLTSLSVFPLRVAKKCGVKVKIVHSHSTTDNREKTAIIKNVLKKFSDRYADERFACGELSGKWLFGEKPFFLMKNAIDLDRFTFDEKARKALREKYAIEGIAVGFAGRMEHQKNLFSFLNIAKKIQSNVPSVAVLVGDGSQKSELEKYAKEQDIRALFIEGTDSIEKWYSAFDCLLMPSFYEGLPLVGIEAQACSLPVFYSSRITEEADFSLAEYFDDEEDATKKILSEDLSRKDVKEKIIARGYDIRTAAKELENEYLLLVKNHR